MHTRSQVPLQRFGLKTARHQGVLRMDNAQPLEPHRVDGVPQGAHTLGEVLSHGLVKALTKAQCIEHACNQAKRLQRASRQPAGAACSKV